MEKILNLDAALAILKKRKTEFSTAYGVTDIGIFGSIVRGEAGPYSDVDIVVKMKKPNLFFMVHIKESLEDDLRCPVDVVRFRQQMNPFLKSRIEKEAVYV
jgi:uncharacterized protein